MKLSTSEDIEAPLSFVFAAFADVENWERAAMRRGADVVRTDKLQSLGVGMSWKVNFMYRGKPRTVTAKLAELERPSHMVYSGLANSLEATISLDFVELSAKRTRITVGTEMKPLTLGARLFLQSLKLAKTKLTKRYEHRVAELCTDIEDRYRAAQKASV